MKYDKAYGFKLSIGYPTATQYCEIEPCDVVGSIEEWDILTEDGQSARLHKAAYEELEGHIQIWCTNEDDDEGDEDDSDEDEDDDEGDEDEDDETDY
jgi:hypothetical protein